MSICDTCDICDIQDLENSKYLQEIIDDFDKLDHELHDVELPKFEKIINILDKYLRNNSQKYKKSYEKFCDNLIYIYTNCEDYRELIKRVLNGIQHTGTIPLEYGPYPCSYGKDCIRNNIYHKEARHSRNGWRNHWTLYLLYKMNEIDKQQQPEPETSKTSETLESNLNRPRTSRGIKKRTKKKKKKKKKKQKGGKNTKKKT